MRVGQPAGDGGREAACRTRLLLARTLERLLRLLVAAQLVQRDRAVELRLDVAFVQRNGLLEFGQRRLGLPQEAQAETGVIADVRIAGAQFQHLRETRESHAVIAPVVGLPTCPDQFFDTWIHAEKIILAARCRHSRPVQRPRRHPGASPRLARNGAPGLAAFSSRRSPAPGSEPPAAAPC